MSKSIRVLFIVIGVGLLLAAFGGFALAYLADGDGREIPDEPPVRELHAPLAPQVEYDINIDADFYVNPSSVTVGAGATFPITITAANITATNITVWQVSLRYDPTVVTVTNSTIPLPQSLVGGPGSYLDNCWDSFSPPVMPTNSPKVWVAAENEMMVGGYCGSPAHSGNATGGILAVVTMQTLPGASGSSVVNIDITGIAKTKLCKSTVADTWNYYPQNLHNGTVQITPPPNVSFSTDAQTVGENVGTVTVIADLSKLSAVAVTVPYTVSGTATGGGADHNLANGNIIIAAGTWSGNTTFNVIDDDLDENDETVIVTMGTPVNANPVAPTVQTITIQDNDTAGITVNPTTGLVTNEAGGTDNFTVVLDSKPTANVTIGLASSDTTEGLASTALLTFTPGNWDSLQQVTVTGQNDDVDDGNIAYTIVTSASVSTDPHYNNVNPPDVSVTNNDDDTAGVDVSPTTADVTEGGATDTYDVVLDTQPTDVVTITIATDGQTTVNPTELVFNDTNWDTAQPVTVTAVDDDLYEASHTGTINHTATSDDTKYNGIAVDDVTANITDNDTKPDVSFSMATQMVDENVGAVIVTAVLSEVVGLDVTVPYLVGGTATGADHNLAAGDIIITAGNLSDNKTFNVTDDALNENNETVIVTMGTPPHANPVAPTVQTITIQDNDPEPTVRFGSATYDVNENAGPKTINVTLSAPSGKTVTVNYATSDGTATVGDDYTAASDTLTFNPGVINRTFNVPIINDTVDEPDETVNLTLSTPVNAGLGTPNPATLTIVDDDVPVVDFSSKTYSVDEGAGTATITVTLDIAAWQQVTVKYTTIDGTAVEPGDYTAISGTLTFAPGDRNKTFNVTINEDTLDEPNETVTLDLFDPTNATIGPNNPATLTIEDNDALPTVDFSSATYGVDENVATGKTTITVTLSAASGQQVTVDYDTSDGTATAGDDYIAATGTLTFTPGVTSQTFDVTITNDLDPEPNETVTLTLSNESNATLGTTNNPATLTIFDDDVTVVDFDSATYSVDEDAGTATITVTLDGPSGLPVTVDYAATGGTATGGGVDYTLAGGTLTFAPSDVSATFQVTITNDTLDEANETVVLDLSNENNANIGPNDPATLTIVDDDPPPTVDFSSATYSEDEDAGTATITVTLSTASGQQITVDYATSDGTATAGDDYTAASGMLTFAPDDVSETFQVTITNDGLDEPAETVTLTLSNESNATLGTANNPATLTIKDDDPPPTVDFDSAAYSEDEDAGTATITVTLSPASGQQVTVDYATSDGTAKEPGDYTAISGTLTFAPDVTSQTFDVTIINDMLDEANETVTLTLSNESNATLGTANNPATLTIVDDDAAPTVDFDSAAYSVDEDAGTATITVTLSPASGQQVTVDYATSDGTAKEPGDYTAISGTLTFAPDVTSQTFDVTIINDMLDEANETVTLTLSNESNATLGTANNPATLTIVDNNDPPTVDFDSATYNVDEGDGTATITVTLSAASGQQVTVDYATSDGTAKEPGDYTAISGTLTFAPDVTSQTFDVTIINDMLDEANETVTLTLSNESNATLGTANNPATLTIVDNNDPPTVDFDSATYNVDEGDGTATITVTLSAASGQQVTVDYATSDGTAKEPGDYTAISGTLTFAPDVTSQTFDVTIINDMLDEANETVTLTLSNESNATLGTANNPATLTIVDNNDPPTVDFDSATYNVDEGDGTATITVTLSAASGQQVTVDYATSDGTATQPDDYGVAIGTLTFAPGDVSETFDVTINEDTLDEPNETVTLTLSNATNTNIGPNSPATLTIFDNDVTVVDFSSATYSVNEDAGTATITVTLDTPSALQVTVEYATSDGTAEKPGDYIAASGTLTFTPGVTSQTFVVTINDDTLDEDDETVTLTLSNASNANIGPNNPATLTIVDDDYSIFLPLVARNYGP